MNPATGKLAQAVPPNTAQRIAEIQRDPPTPEIRAILGRYAQVAMGVEVLDRRVGKLKEELEHATADLRRAEGAKGALEGVILDLDTAHAQAAAAEARAAAEAEAAAKRGGTVVDLPEQGQAGAGAPRPHTGPPRPSEGPPSVPTGTEPGPTEDPTGTAEGSTPAAKPGKAAKGKGKRR